MVAIADCGSGVRQRGQTLASSVETGAAQLGHVRVVATRLGM
jgi:hypothetical protein